MLFLRWNRLRSQVRNGVALFSEGYVDGAEDLPELLVARLWLDANPIVEDGNRIAYLNKGVAALTDYQVQGFVEFSVRLIPPEVTHLSLNSSRFFTWAAVPVFCVDVDEPSIGAVTFTESHVEIV